jgi:hypothetical protein
MNESKIIIVSIPVAEQNRAKSFYSAKLRVMNTKWAPVANV